MLVEASHLKYMRFQTCPCERGNQIYILCLRILLGAVYAASDTWCGQLGSCDARVRGLDTSCGPAAA